MMTYAEQAREIAQAIVDQHGRDERALVQGIANAILSTMVGVMSAPGTSEDEAQRRLATLAAARPGDRLPWLRWKRDIP